MFLTPVSNVSIVNVGQEIPAGELYSRKYYILFYHRTFSFTLVLSAGNDILFWKVFFFIDFLSKNASQFAGKNVLIDNVIKENLKRRKEKLSTGHSFSLNVAYFYNQSCRKSGKPGKLANPWKIVNFWLNHGEIREIFGITLNSEKDRQVFVTHLAHFWAFLFTLCVKTSVFSDKYIFVVS